VLNVKQESEKISLLLQPDVDSRTQSLRPRPRTLKTSESKAKDRDAEDKLLRGQEKGLEDSFENTRKYESKPCNYDFTGIQA